MSRAACTRIDIGHCERDNSVSPYVVRDLFNHSSADSAGFMPSPPYIVGHQYQGWLRTVLCSCTFLRAHCRAIKTDNTCQSCVRDVAVWFSDNEHRHGARSCAFPRTGKRNKKSDRKVALLTLPRRGSQTCGKVLRTPARAAAVHLFQCVRFFSALSEKHLARKMHEYNAQGEKILGSRKNAVCSTSSKKGNRI